MRLPQLLLALFAFAFAVTARVAAAEPFSLPPTVAAAKRIVILGDSITYGGRWAMLVESALRETPRFADAEMVNFGLSSETVSGLSEPGHAGGAFPRPCLHERGIAARFVVRGAGGPAERMTPAFAEMVG